MERGYKVLYLNDCCFSQQKPDNKLTKEYSNLTAIFNPVKFQKSTEINCEHASTTLFEQLDNLLLNQVCMYTCGSVALKIDVSKFKDNENVCMLKQLPEEKSV